MDPTADVPLTEAELILLTEGEDEDNSALWPGITEKFEAALERLRQSQANEEPEDGA